MKTMEVLDRNTIMSLFGTATTGTVEKEQDFSKRTLDTNEYAGLLTMAFAGQSSTGARFVTLMFKLDNGKDYSEQIYISNRDGANTYEKDGKTYYLPGFQLVNNLALLTTGKGLHELAGDVETRTVKLYDWDAKKELPQDVPAIIPMMGKRVLLAITEEEYEKTNYNKETNTREYTGEVRVKNSLTKAYHPETRQSVVELRDGAEATALDGWLKTNKGKLKTVEVKGSASANQKTVAAGTQTPSGLF